MTEKMTEAGHFAKDSSGAVFYSLIPKAGWASDSLLTNTYF